MTTNEFASFVHAGLRDGLATIINNPNDGGIACKIGDNWFCFIDSQYENWAVQKLYKTFSVEELAIMITKALMDMKNDGFLDEVNYYESILLKSYAEPYIEKEN